MHVDLALRPADLLLAALALFTFLTWREMFLLRKGKSRLRDVWAEAAAAIRRQKKPRRTRAIGGR